MQADKFAHGLDRFAARYGERQHLWQFVAGARRELRRLVGVDDLSIIEQAYLLRCVKEALATYADEFSPDRVYGELLLNIPREAAYGWLIATYELPWYLVHDELRRSGGATTEFRELVARWRARSHLL
jgi:hypothetical protein